jgi:KH domain
VPLGEGTSFIKRRCFVPSYRRPLARFGAFKVRNTIDILLVNKSDAALSTIRAAALRECQATVKDLVQFVARQLVNNPDAVEVSETQGATGSILELRVAKEDLGRVIGNRDEP